MRARILHSLLHATAPVACAAVLAVFATAGAEIPLAPAAHRIFVRFADDTGAARGETRAAVQAAGCPSGSTARLTITNQCTDSVWAVVTAPGTPAQAAVAAQWSWMEQYLQHRYFIDTGGQGTIVLDQPNTLAMSATPAPNPAIAEGMTVKVVGAGPSGSDLTTTVQSVDDTLKTVTLTGGAKTAVTNTAVWYYTRQGAFAIASGSSTALCVPDKGAPSGNFRFFMGCPGLGADDTDPFNASGCVIGSAAGDRSGVNTLFEPTFGCTSPLSGSGCAFNAGDTTPTYPQCQGDPNAANCGPLTATDYFDISAVDGYTLPIRVDAAGTACTATSKDASMLDLASCPSEDGRTLHSDEAAQQSLIKHGVSLLTADASTGYLQVCAAPYKWFETTTLGSPVNPTLVTPSCANGSCNAVSFYAGAGCDAGSCAPCADDPTCTVTKCTSCPGGSGPQQKVGPLGNGKKSIQNTSFVQALQSLGYRGYTWQYDDGVGTQTCDAGAALAVTLCPAGSNPKPYNASPLWTFSSTTGSCSTTGASGTPNGATTFGSLFACQTANMQYTCTDLTAEDPFGLPIGIWAADPAATLVPTHLSRTYPALHRIRALECQDFTVPTQGFPADGTISVTNCTYYFKKNHHVKDRVCPG